MRSHIRTYGTLKLDKDGRISRQLTCKDCGYELRGLDPKGQCPECGCVIQETVRAAWIEGRPTRKTVAAYVGAFAALLLLSVVADALYQLTRGHAPTVAGLLSLFAVLFGLSALYVPSAAIVRAVRARFGVYLLIPLLCIPVFIFIGSAVACIGRLLNHWQ